MAGLDSRRAPGRAVGWLVDDISSGGAQIVLSCKPEDLMNHVKARRGRVGGLVVGWTVTKPAFIQFFFF